MREFSFICILLVLSFLLGCGSANTGASYDTPSQPEKEIKKVMVVALTPILENRKTAEKEMEYWLKKDGYNVIASVDYMPTAARLPRQEEIQKAVRNQNIDGVITMRLKDVEEDSRYVSATETHATSLEQTYIYNYVNAWSKYYVPGYYATASILVVETKLFETANDKLIFTATTETFEASSIEKSISNIARTLAGNLKRSKVLTKTEF